MPLVLGCSIKSTISKSSTSKSWIFFEKHSINVDYHTRMNTHPYKYTYIYHTLMSISEKLSRLDLEIHEVGHQERLAVDEDVISH
jgi:hypothetical protein